MNSEQSRFIWQNFILCGVLTFCTPLVTASPNSSGVGSVSLAAQIEQQVLQRWLTIEQRDDRQVNVIISGLPSQYRAPKGCLSALKIKPFKALRIGNNSIEVSCQFKPNWSLVLAADIEVWQKVVVLRNHLTRGEIIGKQHVALQPRNLANLSRGYITSLRDVLGNVSKRSLRAGAALNRSMINLPLIMQRGQTITLRVNKPGISVNMKGIALKKGRLGDKIKVKNSRSEKVLFGTIISSDTVLID